LDSPEASIQDAARNTTKASPLNSIGLSPDCSTPNKQGHEKASQHFEGTEATQVLQLQRDALQQEAQSLAAKADLEGEERVRPASDAVAVEQSAFNEQAQVNPAGRLCDHWD
jgi:hypothetical protein